MIGELLKFVALHDTRKAADRRIQFHALFNSWDAKAISLTDSEHAGLAYAAVRNEIRLADSATFLETFVRRCSDGSFRVAGRVQFSGDNGTPTIAGYTVEFHSNGTAEVIDLSPGVDPVSLKFIATSVGDSNQFKIDQQLGNGRLDAVMWIKILICTLLIGFIIFMAVDSFGLHAK